MTTTNSTPDDDNDRMSRYVWGADDIEIGAPATGDSPSSASVPGMRARVRRAIGDVAHTMSDQDIDRVIAAVTQPADAGPDSSRDKADE